MPLPKDFIKAEQWRQRQRDSHLGKSINKGVANHFYGKRSPRKDKSYEELFGNKKASELKKLTAIRLKGNKYHFGIKHTQKTKEKISIITRQKTPKGKDHPRWKGGVSERYIDIFNGNGYTAWRRDVFERDNYTCQACGDNKGNNLQAHHRITMKIALEMNRLELVYAVSNGITLCNKCHKKEHKHATN